MPLNASEETLLRLRWNFVLLPKLLGILALGVGTSNYSEPEGISLLRRYTRRRSASDETIHEATAQVELHLFHLASDVVELSFFVPSVRSALDQAQEEARLAIQRLSNPDPDDETIIAGHTLFSRGGRPVTADPVKDFRGHSDAFVMRTLRTAGPALGLDGRKPTEETCTKEHIGAAQQLEATLTTESRGMMLRAVPSRLHREWAHGACAPGVARPATAGAVCDFRVRVWAGGGSGRAGLTGEEGCLTQDFKLHMND